MDWKRKKANLFENVRSRLGHLTLNGKKSFVSSKSFLPFDHQIRIPILIDRIYLHQVSTQTSFNNSILDELSQSSSSSSHRRRRRQRRRRRREERHHRDRFNQCLKELMEKSSPIGEHQFLSVNESEKDENSSSLRWKSSNGFLKDFDRTEEKTSIESFSIDQRIWRKLLESREDLAKLNSTLQDLDQRLERLSFSLH